ncbi:MAG: T9SS type A sorting domain-containing protein [Saprospiraceae bacterium]|nr:T9SS type A sorting domain-containing protein [Saprospiraceae bacterium]
MNFYNCAFINNQSKQGGSIGYLESGIANFYNCMIDNAKNDSTIYYNNRSAFARVNFENTFFDTDALLANPEAGDFSLSPCSPAIDKGDNRYVAQNNLVDISGNPRIINERVDIGAYENIITPLEIEFDIIGNSCQNTNTGYADFEFKNGCAPYIYTWERSGEKGTGNTDLAIGTYNFTITDGVGKQGQVSLIIDTFNVRYGSTLIVPTCPENKDGAISISTLSQDSLSYLWANGSTDASIRDLGVGQYAVTITNQGGCQATTQFELTILDTIQVSFSLINASSSDSSDGKINIDSILGGQAPYKVTVNTVPIERVSSLSVGNYQLRVEDAKGCVKIIPFSIDIATSTREWQSAYKVEIFPNPASNNSITIKLPEPLDLKTTVIRIVDLHGKVVYQKIPLGRLHEVQTSNLAAAIYMVQVIGENYSSSEPLMVEK